MRLPHQTARLAALVPVRDRARGTSTLAVVLLVLWAVGLCALIGQRVRFLQESVGWIDPRSLRLRDPGPGFDPRWEALFDATTARFPLLRADDRAGLAELASAIGALSFVRAVGEPHVDPAGQLSLELVLRVPAACVPIGERYQPVAADGVLLPGLWPAPPEVGGVPLAVLGPLSDARTLFPFAREGDFLAEPRHEAALDVAVSLSAALDAQLRAQMGPILIDATATDEAFPDQPCIRIELGSGREVRFGRAPSSEAPGELAAEHKWTALAQALALLERGDPALDWDQVDLRWDHPELRLVNAQLVADAEPATRPDKLGASTSGRSAARAKPTVASRPALDVEPAARAPGPETTPKRGRVL